MTVARALVASAALALVLVPARGQAGPAAPGATPVPVRLGGVTVYEVRVGVGSLSPEERAGVVARRLEALVDDWRFAPGRLAVVDAEDAAEVRVGDRVLVTVREDDAAAAGVPRAELARRIAAAIDDAVQAERASRSGRDLPRKALIAAGALLGLVALLRVLGWVFRVVGRRVSDALDRELDDPRRRWLQIVPKETARRWNRLAGRGLRALVYVVPAYVFLLVLLGLFPVTMGWAAYLVGASREAAFDVGRGLLGFVPRLLSLALIAAVAWLAIRGARIAFEAVAHRRLELPGFDADWAMPSFRLVRLLLIVFAVIVMAPFLPGFGTGAFQGVSVFLGLLLSIGSGSAVANMVAGTTLTYTSAFRLGDRVGIGETVGDVVEKTMLVTRVRTIKNVIVTLPNSAVLGSSVINYSAAAREAGLILNTGVTIGYDVPWRTVHGLLIQAARDTAGIVAEPAPFVLQTALHDFYVAYELNATTRDASAMAQLYSDLHRNIQDRFAEAGVEIMSPHYNALRDGNAPALPPATAADEAAAHATR